MGELKPKGRVGFEFFSTLRCPLEAYVRAQIKASECLSDWKFTMYSIKA